MADLESETDAEDGSLEAFGKLRRVSISVSEPRDPPGRQPVSSGVIVLNPNAFGSLRPGPSVHDAVADHSAEVDNLVPDAPEHMGSCDGVIDEMNDHADPDAAVDASSHDVTPDEGVTQEQYDRALFEARRVISSSESLDLPWETGVFASIFGDAELVVPGPTDAIISPFFPESFDLFQEAVAKPSADVASTKRNLSEPFHASVLSSLRDVDAKQLESDLWESAISKWQFVFSMVNYAGPIGERLQHTAKAGGGVDAERRIIRDVLGVKSPRTASKRADSLRRFFAWCYKHDCMPWPILATRVIVYLSGDDGAGLASTTGLALLEGAACSHFFRDRGGLTCDAWMK